MMTRLDQDLAKAGRKRIKADAAADAARAEFRATVRKAWANGTPVARIAELAGVSRQTVYGVLREER